MCCLQCSEEMSIPFHSEVLSLTSVEGTMPHLLDPPLRREDLILLNAFTHMRQVILIMHWVGSMARHHQPVRPACLCLNPGLLLQRSFAELVGIIQGGALIGPEE